MISRDTIREAARAIAPYIHRTAVMRSDAFGPRVQFKFEHVQVTGTFKARGAFWSMLSRDVPEAGIVAASGGNHGAAVAHAATTLGHAAHIFVPEIAGPTKIGAIRATGAHLHVVPGAYANAAEAAATHQAQSGAMDVHPYDGVATVTGQATTFAEWDDQGCDADTVLIAVGGGGLIAGAMSWWSDKRIIGVETHGTATLQGALQHGGDHLTDVSGICANALGAKRIGAQAYHLARARIHHPDAACRLQVLQVSDEDVAAAQVALWQHLRQWVEPAGAAALAALMAGAYQPAPDERVAVLICGANPAPGPFAPGSSD